MRVASAGLALAVLVSFSGCGADPEPRPDGRLQDELGLSSQTEVHRISISGGLQEAAVPSEVRVSMEAYVEFVTTDAWVHEVRFELDSLPRPARDFILRTDQGESPPMVNADSRFLVSMRGAPPGRYPFRIEGNGGPARGAVVVAGEGG